jgi:hypothetical protein
MSHENVIISSRSFRDIFGFLLLIIIRSDERFIISKLSKRRDVSLSSYVGDKS